MNRKQVRNRTLLLSVSLLAGMAIGLWMNERMPERQNLPAAAKAADEPDGASRAAGAGAADMRHEHAHDDAADMDMDMSGMAPGAEGADAATWTWPDGAPRAGEASTLRVTITDAAGKPDAGLQVNHEKKLHLIVVSQGLSTFLHLHPAETAEPGVFEGDVTFPSAGRYKLIADFKPADGAQQWRGAWVQAEGGGGTRQTEPALAADKRLERTADGVAVKLSFDRAPKAGEAVKLAFSFADAASGEPVRDLQPYLGAAGHVVILGADADDYLHVHAMSAAGGPVAEFHATFPKPGLYKLWGQFQRNGRVMTVPFVVEAA
ncbi:hypothetical protein [Paenibacillus sp. UNC496MF]|uniref:hypothetical protein n=1 Tax=Paenibacillus sp. UNC496MF TaxID=1502753 RepID=UPI00116081AC|nr:hypothetical protein [Paenibacillus sp. UNC496MF]